LWWVFLAELQQTYPGRGSRYFPLLSELYYSQQRSDEILTSTGWQERHETSAKVLWEDTKPRQLETLDYLPATSDSQQMSYDDLTSPYWQERYGPSANASNTLLQNIDSRQLETLNYLPAAPGSQLEVATVARRRLGVPLSFPGQCGKTTVMCCADTGADENVMTLEEAQRLGLVVTSEEADLKAFCLADGKSIRSLGKAVSGCDFSQGSAAPDALVTTFYVFQTLIEPIIMGLGFLELTETLTKHRDRLIQFEVPSSLPLRVLSIGMPKGNLVCRLASNTVLANADSGSDLDFISGNYARTHNIDLVPNNEKIMLADGSIVTTSGIARLSLLVGEPDTYNKSENSPSSIEISSEFHVFDDMIHDVLIGYASIEKLKVFTRHNDSLLPGVGLSGMSGINIIRHLKKTPIPEDIQNLWPFSLFRHLNGKRVTSQDGKLRTCPVTRANQLIINSSV
jgi:hypothetical protein